MRMMVPCCEMVFNLRMLTRTRCVCRRSAETDRLPATNGNMGEITKEEKGLLLIFLLLDAW